ncbi:hypothetical protein ACWEC4_42095 [Streptomyces sp. NPDC005055]
MRTTHGHTRPNSSTAVLPGPRRRYHPKPTGQRRLLPCDYTAIERSAVRVGQGPDIYLAHTVTPALVRDAAENANQLGIDPARLPAHVTPQQQLTVAARKLTPPPHTDGASGC